MQTPISQNEEEVAGFVLRHWHSAVPNDRMAHLIKDSTRVFLRSLQLKLARHKVPLGYWTFLRILWERDGLTQTELSVEAGFTESTTMVALHSMESLGYVTREHRAGNRKNLYVFLTSAGKHLKSGLVPLAEEVNAVAVSGISCEEIAVTRRTLLAMIENLARDPVVNGSSGNAELCATKDGTAARYSNRRVLE